MWNNRLVSIISVYWKARTGPYPGIQKNCNWNAILFWSARDAIGKNVASLLASTRFFLLANIEFGPIDKVLN